MNISQPDISDAVTRGQVEDFASHAELERVEFENINLSSILATNLSLQQVRLNKCVFTGTQLQRLHAKDVVLKDCDFTTAKCSEATVSQVRFAKCRMDGLDISGAELKDVIFEDCKLDLANFRMSKLKRVQFINCTLKETDFLSAELDEVEFTGCTIDQTSFDQVTAKRVDLSDSELISLIGWESLKGVTIDSLQLITSAVQIVTALGLKVKE